jgi:SH3-like domain-containing protein
MTAGLEATLSPRLRNALKEIIPVYNKGPVPPQLPGELIPEDETPGTFPTLHDFQQDLRIQLRQQRLMLAIIILLGVGIPLLLQSGLLKSLQASTPFDPVAEANRILAETAAAQTATAAPTATPTYDVTGTIGAILTNFYVETAEAQTAVAAAWTDTPTATQTPTLSPTTMPTSTEDMTITANAQATQDSEATRAILAATDIQATSDAQATLNVPTNTPEPTATSTETPSPTPTDTPPPTPTFTSVSTFTSTPDFAATANAQAIAHTQAAIDAQSTIAVQQTQTQAAMDAYTDTPTAHPTSPPIGIVSSNQSVNVRSGPGTENAVVNSLSPGNVVVVLGESDDGTWINVRLPDATDGWVSNTLVSMITSDSVVPVTSNNNWLPVIQTFDTAEMVLVPPGCFMMGESGEGGEQCFSVPYWIDRYEITNEQYGPAGNYAGDDYPRGSVTWFDARDYCFSRGARLPTEAEWEYAARGPDNKVFPWGNTFNDENVSYAYNSTGPSEVSSRPTGASWVGATHMSGNLREWTSTIYQPYPYSAVDGRENYDTSDANRVVRGGSWNETELIVRLMNRQALEPTYQLGDLGFRCARGY